MNRIERATNLRSDEISALSTPDSQALVACTWAYAAAAIATGLAAGAAAAYGYFHGYQPEADADDFSGASVTDLSTDALLRARESVLAA